MKIFQGTVTAADIQPGGWVCEGCGYRFEVGDEVFGEVISEYGDDPYGLDSLSMGGTASDYDVSSGVVCGNSRCRACFDAAS